MQGFKKALMASGPPTTPLVFQQGGNCYPLPAAEVEHLPPHCGVYHGSANHQSPCVSTAGVQGLLTAVPLEDAVAKLNSKWGGFFRRHTSSLAASAEGEVTRNTRLARITERRTTVGAIPEAEVGAPARCPFRYPAMFTGLRGSPQASRCNPADVAAALNGVSTEAEGRSRLTAPLLTGHDAAMVSIRLTQRQETVAPQHTA